MADLRIRNVDSRSMQPAGQAWPVTVAVNNLETVAFAWEPGTCNENGEPGHKANVTLEVRSSAGGEVWSETKQVCVPRNRVGQLLGANKRVEFTPVVDTKGEYTLTASVEAVNSSGGDTSDPVRVTATGVEETEQADSGVDNGGGDAWNPFPDDSGGNDPLNVGGQMDKLLLAVGLIAVAWLANSGAEVLG